MKKVTDLVENLKKDLINRDTRLRENVDYKLLNNFILKSRGLDNV